MALFLVTGTPGTGKSQVCLVLKQRGYEAYDADGEGLARWQHKRTGSIYPVVSLPAQQRTPDFLANHDWNAQRRRIEELANKAARKPIFLCGSFSNESELRDLFVRIFALYVNDETLKHRLARRTTNDWGKQPHELQKTLRHHHRIYKDHARLGDVIIDAAQPLDKVVDDILMKVGERASV